MAREIYVPSDWPEPKIERDLLRIADIHDPQEVRATFSLLTRINDAFVDSVLALPKEIVETRPDPDSWSVLEHVRHLLFADQLHLEHHVLRYRTDFSPLGLASDHLSRRPEFATVGTVPNPDLAAVIAPRHKVWEKLAEMLPELTRERLSMRIKTTSSNSTVGGVLQGLVWHNFGHFRLCDQALKKVAKLNSKKNLDRG